MPVQSKVLGYLGIQMHMYVVKEFEEIYQITLISIMMHQ